MASTEGENVLGFPLGSPATTEDVFVQGFVGNLLEGNTLVLPQIPGVAESQQEVITHLDPAAVASMRRWFRQMFPQAASSDTPQA